jgi:hypothetical protein
VVRASLHVCWGQGYPQAYPCSTALLQYNTPRTMHVQFSTHTHTRAHTRVHTDTHGGPGWQRTTNEIAPRREALHKRCTTGRGAARHGTAPWRALLMPTD